MMRTRFLPTPALMVLAVAALVAVIASPARALDIQRIEGGGVEAWLVEDHSLPVIALKAAFRGGASLDPAGKEGLARMTGALLDEGAGEMSATAFQDALEDRAIELGFGADLDALGVSLRALSRDGDAAVDLLNLALTRPRFDADAIERIRGQLQSRVRQAADEPDSVAWDAYLKASFPDHVYGRPVEGTLESLAAITAEDLKTFARDALTRDRLIVAIVGDVTPSDASRMLATAFGNLPLSGPSSDVPNVEPRTGLGVLVRPVEARQSSLVFGQGGVWRDDPDYYVYAVVSRIFGGGGLTSRLFDAVREEEGLAYSISASPMQLDHAALFIGRGGTVNERVGETIDVVRREWRRLHDEGVTADEVTDAKAYLIGSFPLGLTSSSRIASTLVSLQQENLGIDYIDRRAALIGAVGLEDANRIARSKFNADALTIVVAGEPDGDVGKH
jgi:zinc protease